MVDPTARAFFEEQLAVESNRVCVDSDCPSTCWASISYGIYIAIGAAGVHRSLGVQVSFVQSTTMDSWKPLHLKMMALGGNQRFQQFLDQHGVRRDMPIRDKYQTRAAEWYRRNLRAEAEGLPLPEALPLGTGHLPTCTAESPEQRVLNEVFARAPGDGDMTSGGVMSSCTSRRSARGASRRTKKCSLESLIASGREQLMGFLDLHSIALRPAPTPTEEEQEPCRSRSRSRSLSPAPAVRSVQG